MTPPTNRRHWARPPAPSGRDGHNLGVLDEDECLRLLATQPVGRLGFSAGGLPVIHPVNYVLEGRTIVFRSEPGQKVDAAMHGSVACLQVDMFDAMGHGGWSVLATGRLAVAPPTRAAELARLPLSPWALAEPSSFIEMPAELLSGRTIDHTPNGGHMGATGSQR